MFARAITILLAAAVAATASAGAAAREQTHVVGRASSLATGRQAEEPARVDLTPEEKREARESAVRVVKRMHEAGDAGLVVAEFFLPDFAERFQQFVRDKNLPDGDVLFTGVSRDVLVRADPGDLRRTFVALVNLWHHSNQYGHIVSDVTEARHNLASVFTDEENWRLRGRVAKEALPPAFFETCKGDPMLALLVELVDGESESTQALAGEDGSDDDESNDDALMLEKVRAASVQSVARLRSLTEKLEKCVVLMRDATKKLREELKAYPGRSPERAVEADDVYRVETDTYDREAFGFPAGTPLVSARLFPYVVVMARVEGRFKVLGILPDFDGD